MITKPTAIKFWSHSYKTSSFAVWSWSRMDQFKQLPQIVHCLFTSCWHGPLTDKGCRGPWGRRSDSSSKRSVCPIPARRTAYCYHRSLESPVERVKGWSTELNQLKANPPHIWPYGESNVWTLCWSKQVSVRSSQGLTIWTKNPH